LFYNPFRKTKASIKEKIDDLSTIFSVGGLSIDFIGAVFLASTLFVSKRKAVERAVNRLSGETYEENLTLYPVQAILKDAKHARSGVIFLAFVFLMQIFGALIN